MTVRRPLSIIAMPAAADGSGYHRLYLPFKRLAEHSRHLTMIPPPGKVLPMPTRDDLEDVDVLVMQRPVGAVGMRTMDTLEGVCARVYEVDDDLLTVHPSQQLTHLCDERVRDSVRYCLERADMVTVSMPHLAEEYSKYNGNIRVLPNTVSGEMLDLRRKRRERVTVGWAGGSSHLMDHCAVQDPLRAVLDANPDVDMHYVGVDYSPLVGRECRFSRWEGDVWRYYAAIDFDIGIAPLADVKFNYSKSYLKALDYAALGIPVVAQDLPPYHDFVVDGVTGYLVRTPQEWVARLTELIHDTAAREEMGAKARDVAAEYTIGKRWREFERAYEEAAGYGAEGG